MDRPWIYDATITDWLILFGCAGFGFILFAVIEDMNKEFTRRIKQLENEIELLTGKKLQ